MPKHLPKSSSDKMKNSATGAQTAIAVYLKSLLLDIPYRLFRMRIRIIYGINVANLQKNIQFCLESNKYFTATSSYPIRVTIVPQLCHDRASVVSRSCLSCVTIVPQLCHDRVSCVPRPWPVPAMAAICVNWLLHQLEYYALKNLSI